MACGYLRQVRKISPQQNNIRNWKLIEKLKKKLERADAISVCFKKQKTSFEKGSAEYNEIMDVFKRTVKNAREMPAFGVALNDLTLSFEGLALEFVFHDVQKHGEMPFEKLFVRTEKHYMGINLERYYDGAYQGRCFYLNLDKNLEALCLVMVKYIDVDAKFR